MDRAGGRSCYAATRAAELRVSSGDRNRPFTMREKEEKKWMKEKNGRRVLKISNGNGHHRYWRAPRPRPRPNRRQRRRRKKAVTEVAIQGPPPPAASVGAAEVILVLQNVLQTAVQAKEEAQQKLEKTRRKLQKKREQYSDLQQEHEDELAENARQVHQLKEKLKRAEMKNKAMRKDNEACNAKLKKLQVPAQRNTNTAAAVPRAPRGEFDAEFFRTIPPEERTEWEQSVVEEAAVAEAAREAAFEAYLESKRRSDEADLAYIAAQDRAALIQAVWPLVLAATAILIVAYIVLSQVYTFVSSATQAVGILKP